MTSVPTSAIAVSDSQAGDPPRPARKFKAPVWVWIGAIALLLVVGGLVASAINRHPKNFGVVDEGKIYRSGELTPAAMERVFREYHIRTVIDLGAFEPGTGEEARAERIAKAMGVTRYAMDLEGDATGNPNYYVQALRIMNDPEKQPVLVHCSAGTQRTGCLVMLQRHVVEGKAYGDVFHEAVEHRHDPKDNPHLLLMLAEWSDKIAEAYRNGTSIPGVEELAPAKAGGAAAGGATPP
jgi:tyrosine-protein phosphatase SIW14